MQTFFYWIIYGHMTLDNYVFSDNLKISLTQQSTFTTPILIQQTCDNSIATLDNLYLSQQRCDNSIVTLDNPYFDSTEV